MARQTARIEIFIAYDVFGEVATMSPFNVHVFRPFVGTSGKDFEGEGEVSEFGRLAAREAFHFVLRVVPEGVMIASRSLDAA